jgi:CHAT domain-containing protein/Tfp pilus assembly protein PilF
MGWFTGLALAAGLMIAFLTSICAPWNSRAKVVGIVLAAALVLSSNAAALTFKDVQNIESNYNQLYSIGHFREAVPVAEQLADAVKAVFGARHPNYAAVRQTLAQAYYNAGVACVKDSAYGEAEKFYKRALELREQLYPRDHPDIAQTYDSLGTAKYFLGLYREALTMHSQGLAIRQRIADLDRVTLSDSLHNVGGDYWMLARYAEAEQAFTQALAIREEKLGDNHPKVAHTLSNLGLVYQVTGRFVESEKVLNRSLEIREQLYGGQHPDVANSLNNLGNGYWIQGRYSEAEAAHKRALDIREKAFGSDHPSVAESLLNLGNVYFFLARHEEAERDLRRALTIEENVNPNQRSVALILQALAGVYEDLGGHADAEALRKRGLAILEKLYGPDHPEIAANLTALASNYMAQKRFSEVEPLLKRALAIREKLLSGEHSDHTWTMATLGEFYRKQGRLAEAKTVLERALAIQEKTLEPHRLEMAITMQSLGEAYLAGNELERAQPMFERALAIREQSWGKNNRDVAETRTSLAKVKFAKGAVAPALEDAREATAGLIGRSQAFSTGRLGRRDAAGAELRPYFIEHLYVAYRAGERGGSSEALGAEGFVVSQAALNAAAANALSQMGVRFAARTGPLADLVRRRQDLGSRWHALDQLLIEGESATGARRNEAVIRGLRGELASIETQVAEADARLAKEFPEYNALANPKPLSLPETQALLAADEAMVSYLVGEKTSYVFAVSRDGFSWKELKIGADELNKTVSSIRAGLDYAEILRKKASPVKLEALHELYLKILRPVDDFVRPKAKLIVVPDGALTSLPFQLLVTEPPKSDNYRNAAYLIRRHAITVSPSVASLKVLRQSASLAPASKPLTGFGDPVLDRNQPVVPGAREAPGRSLRMRSFASYFRGSKPDIEKLRTGLAPLPNTARELRSVAAALGAPTSEIKLGADATEPAVKSSPLRNYRIVYFATHGLVSGEINGLAEPALVLTLPERPSEEDDGLLTASEVAELKLNADWVVLSACNTAAGDPPGAEGLSGLARAFFYAGARALLVSHWSVDDDAAAAITTGAFTRLSKDPSLGRAEALRQATLALLDNSANPEDAFPAVWAPFVIVGEGGGVPSR